MGKRAIALVAVGAAALAAGSAGGTPAQTGTSDFGARCEVLTGQRMGEVVITSAEFLPEGRTIPAGFGGPEVQMPPHCLVTGTINRRTGAGGVEYGIGFELALPLEWTGRYLLQGGGGLNGSVRPPVGPVAAGADNALARGFAVASHDSGHRGAVFDNSFYADQRAALNFAEASVRTVTLATRAITAQFYQADPHHSYMTGCSTGGREGMLASQRYPELFDGIVVGAPAMRPGHGNLAIELAQVQLNATQPAGTSTPAGFDATERRVIERELTRQCDGRDGREDGIIANVEACRAFDPSALQCRAGQTGGQTSECIASPKVEVLREAFAGRDFYTAIPWDTGITYNGPGIAGYLPSGQPGPFGPATSARAMDEAARLRELEWDAVGRLTDTAYWTNLSTYLGRGSKIMYYHGVSDPWFSAYDTWDYFERAREANGAEAWDQAARFYMMPGMLHCGGGESFDRIDLLTAMVEWVEGGTAPAGLTATRSSGAPGERPLCPHPAYPHYVGGDPDTAASYACRGG
ncbi:MAG: tannase/feruloyl esterase family alpha/beta hydrolase [Erythrobacter sp.]|nr:MAG: tannase/feruloyl esterase family alpha/beta hydrolase [Erythrobacter sp.]